MRFYPPGTMQIRLSTVFLQRSFTVLLHRDSTGFRAQNFLFLLTIIFCLQLVTHAQTTREERNSPLSEVKDRRSDLSPFGSPEEEMRDRLAVKHQEAAHKENLERAKENAQLGIEMRAAFERHKTLGRDEVKKLERMEKLARKIRGQAGGSDDQNTLQDPPRNLENALARLAELSEELHKQVEKTSRLVVSAVVIEHSNEVIELVRYIRTLTP